MTMDVNREVLINKDHYFNKEYLKKERLYSFAEQIELVKQYAQLDDSILEIGKGNGYVNDFLKRYLGFKSLQTMDINPELEPDIVDDISQPQNFNDNSYDVILCFEVLEHMPFEKSVQAVKNMVKLARKFVFISIPDMRYFISFRSIIFGSGPIFINKLFSTRRFRKTDKKFGKDHFWEIGLETETVKYSEKHVRNYLFKDQNLVKDYRDIAVPWHHYFVIKID